MEGIKLKYGGRDDPLNECEGKREGGSQLSLEMEDGPSQHGTTETWRARRGLSVSGPAREEEKEGNNLTR